MPVINYLAVLVAAIGGWLVGAIWYNVLRDQWLSAQGWTAADVMTPGRRTPPIGLLIVAFAAQLLMALMLAGIVGHMGPPNVTNGIVSAVLIWFGFVITVMIVNDSFQKRKLSLTVINGGHWLVVLLLQGLVLGLFG